LEKTDVVVIGGGIIGTSAAFFLSSEGVDVTLIERFEIGLEASGSNAGSMALQNKELDVIPLVQESLRTWAELQTELQVDLEFRQNGGFRVAEDNQQLQVLRRSVGVQKKLGLEVTLLSSQELKSCAPYLGPSVVAASYCDKDARGNPLLSSIALARAAEARGARICANEEVKSIEVNSRGRFSVETSRGGYRSTCIVNSAGVWAKDIFRMVGLDYPITMDPQQVMVTEQVPSIFSHIITHVEGNLTLKQMDSGNVLIGGGWKGIGDMDNNIKRVRYESLIGNLRYACRVIPSLNDLNLIRCWAGLEGRSPDLLPVFGNLNHLPGFYSACCTKGGFTLGPILGKLISELIVKGKTSFPIKAFDANRFTDPM
jgi:glycine/D-amino acid oxidase-like deaminating enzyme